MIEIEISKKVFNEIYLPYLDNEDRFLIFYGGASSGKSYFIAQRYIYKMLNRKMNLLVVRKTGDTNSTSTFPLIKNVINSWGLRKYFKINESSMRIKCNLNGNEIVFKGLDDVEKIKSTTFESGELTDVWIEEASECDENDIKQLNVRLRGGKIKKQIVMSFNPIDINHFLKKQYIDTKKATFVHTTYKDNKFLMLEDIQELENYKYTDPYYYTVYCLGEWGVYGKTIFNAQAISERISKLTEPIKIGFFDYETYYDENKNEVLIKNNTIKWIEDLNGYIKIYKNPKKDYPYVLGGDTAGDGSDNFTGQVLNNVNGEQVAVLKHQFDDDLYAKQMYCLGYYYNKALIGIETNYSTYPNKELERLGYPNMFIREREDNFTHKIIKAFGFETNKKTRPVIIAELVEFARENIDLINDKSTLEEMLTFVRNEKGRPEAQNGAHDDLIMAKAIAHYIRPQQEYKVQKTLIEKRKKKEYTFDFDDSKNYGDYGAEIKIV